MRQHFLRNLWRWKAGLPEVDPPRPFTIEDLEKTEWSPEFERLMRNRLVMGAFRYGRLRPGAGSRYDRLKAIMWRLQLYHLLKNKEYLVDIANFALCEFVEARGEFKSVDDGEHAEAI